MTQRQTACDRRRVSLFLAQQLGDEEQTAFERHLETCEICRQQLENEAGSGDDWREAGALLGPEGDVPLTIRDEPSVCEEFGADVGSVLGLLAPTDDPAMIGRLSGYEIVGVIGRGGMGVVLKGFDPRLNRFVAIKTLAPHLAANGSARRRFAREARAAAAVVHENVIAIHGVAEWQGLPYLVMPYVRGESLQKRLDRTGPQGVQEVLRIGRQTAAGLSAAHDQGLIHRDIKPANILLEEGVDRLQLTDFGLARTMDDASETRSGIIAGTPQYMSPEQARGDALDPRSDLFSLGSVMYTMCTGRPAFRAETPYGILRRITDEVPRPIREINPDVPDWLAGVIDRLHDKAPQGRFESAAQLAELLGDCLAHVQSPGSRPLPEEIRRLALRVRPGPKSGRRKHVLIAVWLAAAGLLAAASAVALQSLRPTAVDDPSELSKLPSSATSPSATEDVSATDDAHSDPPGWDDLTQDLSDLDADVDQTEARVLELWDREPVPLELDDPFPFEIPPDAAAGSLEEP
ncbi:MAG: protein kinase [Planctomyces sp.]|nr:protein kinase [Planctomyces sp.]